MSEEINKMNEEELEDVSGGRHGHKHHHEYKTHDEVPGAIYVNEQLPVRHHKKSCECGNKDCWSRYFCVFDGDRVYPGMECPKCGKRWLVGDPLRA